MGLSAVQGTNRRGQLALTFQEAFTVAARLRTKRQVASDANSFRAQVKQLLGAADQEARRIGYSGETVKLSVYAYVAFIDEAVLNSQQAMFTDWPRKPLQEEIFGDNTAGEIFFENLNDLLRRQDSDEVADLLEVYEVCLLLGFRGRYSVSHESQIRTLMNEIWEKIHRIRGYGDLAPSWGPPAGEIVPIAKDPWLKRLAYGAIGLFTLAVILFIIFDISLGPAVRELERLGR